MQKKQYTFLIYGKVQGVSYRAFTLAQLRQLSCKGEVKNCMDGSVQCIAEGDTENLEKLEQRLSVGPPAARVERIEKQSSAFSLHHEARITDS